MGKISFTTDMWTDDFNKRAYMAVTAHWLQSVSLKTSSLQPSLSLRTDLIGFVYVPSSHTGEHLARVFLSIIDRLKIANKVFYYYLNSI
jgi:hypothetical protein